MIKIYLPNLNYKFYNNLKLINDFSLSILTGSSIDIYKTHYHIKANIYIFDSYFITNEIMEFISEYCQNGIKIYIYHDSAHTMNKDAVRYIKQANHLLYGKEYDLFPKYPNLIKIPDNLVNTNVFTNKKLPRQEAIAYFLDKDSEIPMEIKERLFPKSKDKILLFNNNHIKHPQNLGFLSEQDKSNLLNEIKYFIPNKYEDYALEAVLCGCDVIDMSSKECITQKYLTALREKTTYYQFLKSNIL